MEDVSDEFAEIMSPVQATRTRRTNKFFARLAAYTSGHANPAYERNGSANSVLSGGKVTDTTPLESQRATLKAFEPLLHALNPTFKLDYAALVHSGYYIESSALAVLPRPSAVGSQ